MRTTRAKVIILAVLLGVWALVFFVRLPGGDQPARSGPVQTAARMPRTPAGETPRLKTELLNVPRAPYPAEVQSIFSSPPPPPPPPPSSVANPGGLPAAPPAPPPDPFQEEAKQLRYVGFLQSGTVATAFIVRGQEVHTVAVGGLLGERFRVIEVRDDSVILGSPAGDKQVRLSLATEAGASPRAPELITPAGPREAGPAPSPISGGGAPPQLPSVIPGPGPRPGRP
jgi:hypothetical protein